MNNKILYSNHKNRSKQSHESWHGKTSHTSTCV